MGRDLNSSSPFPGTDPMRATDAAPLRLLLVEDSPADAYLVKLAMREEGLSCDVQVASDGQLAIEFIDQMDAKNGASLNLLLLDLNVPRRTGDEVLERIRRSPKCANIPVIVVTSSDSLRIVRKRVKWAPTNIFGNHPTSQNLWNSAS